MVPESNSYHIDLTTGYGVKYFWLGRVTSVIGQDTKRRLTGIWSHKCPLESTITVGKEFIKGILPLFGNTKYSMHADNRILRQVTFANGADAWEFMRCNPSPWGVSAYETGDGIGKVINNRFLGRLIKRGGKCILYTHLGKLADTENKFNNQTKKAFELLKSYSNANDILVTTTKRLLDYTLMTSKIRIDQTNDNGKLKISLNNPDHLSLDGLSIKLDQDNNFELYVNNTLNSDYKVNLHKGGSTLYFPWHPLKQPNI